MYQVPRVLIASINPICAACQVPIGEMTLELYLKAVERRGPYLLCPDCRVHKCDCCGFLYPTETTLAYYTTDRVFLGNACRRCFYGALRQEATREDFPAFFSYAPPNLIRFEATYQSAQELIRAEEGERWDR